MASTYLSPAPGRRVVRLGRGWAAVLLQLIPGGRVAAVGLFYRGNIVAIAEEPAEVRRLELELGRVGGEGRAPW